MKPGDDESRDIAFFTPDVTDVSTIKRADMFTEKGFTIVVFGFRRARYNRDFQPRWPYVELGETRDGNYVRRALVLLRAIATLFRRRKLLKPAAQFYARNIDQLILAVLARKLARSRARIIYEVLDVQPAFVGESLYPRLLRLVERIFLGHVSLIVVSSPGFMRNYFEPLQGYRGDWFLLENKLHAPAVQAIGPVRETLTRGARHKSKTAQNYKWVVSYAGLIRGQRTFNLITRLAQKFESEVLFKFHGILTTVNPAAFRAVIARHRNMLYCGEYVNPRDLADVYSDTDFVWALDLENVDGNSRWLLPCRFYEAGYLGLPCLVARDFEVGRKVDALGAGWTFSAPFEKELTSFFATVTPGEYEEKRRRLAELPPSTFLARNDTSALCRVIADGAISPNSSPSYIAHRTTARQLIPVNTDYQE